MARHSLFPNSITINYTSNGHSHKMVLPVAAISGSAPGWLLTARNDSAVDWRDAVDDFAVLMAAMMDDADSVDSADLYTYEATDGPAEFLASHVIGQSGTSVSATKPWVQVVFPFKAPGNTQLRLTVMEGVMDPDDRQTFASSAYAPACAIMEFILGSDDWIITRGGDYPTTALGFTTKINDKLRKAYLLN